MSVDLQALGRALTHVTGKCHGIDVKVAATDLPDHLQRARARSSGDHNAKLDGRGAHLDLPSERSMPSVIIQRREPGDHHGPVIVSIKNFRDPCPLDRVFDDVNVPSVECGLQASKLGQREIVIFDPELCAETDAVVDHKAAVCR